MQLSIFIEAYLNWVCDHPQEIAVCAGAALLLRLATQQITLMATGEVRKFWLLPIIGVAFVPVIGFAAIIYQFLQLIGTIFYHSTTDSTGQK